MQKNNFLNCVQYFYSLYYVSIWEKKNKNIKTTQPTLPIKRYKNMSFKIMF